MNFKEYINKSNLSGRQQYLINTELEKIFNNQEFRNHLSNKYPEIFPEHLGIYFDEDGKYNWCMFYYKHISDDWEDKGWNHYNVNKNFKYVIEAKKFFEQNNEEFYEFLEMI